MEYLIALLRDTGLLAVAWGVIALALVGLGCPAIRLLGRRTARAADLQPAFWVGLAVAVCALQLWHFVSPIDARVGVLLTLAALVGVVTHRSGLVCALHEVCSLGLLALAGFGLLVVLCAVWALGGAITQYDAGLYHLQTIKWETSYPVVPGLGNLHGRLAFNSSFFLYLALLKSAIPDDWYFRIGSGLFALALLMGIAASLVGMAQRKSLTSISSFDIVVAIPVIGLIAGSGLATTSTDLPILILQVLVARELLAVCVAQDDRARSFSVAYVSILCALGTTVKLTFAFYGAAAMCAALIVAASGPSPWSTLRRAGASAVPALLLMGIPWLLHGVVLSGYPVYPSTVLGVPVDWRVSPGEADLEGKSILAFARAPGPGFQRAMEGWDWVGEWAARNWRELAPPAVVCALGAAAVSWGRRDRAAVEVAAVLVLPASVAILAWFFSAPDPRFAGSLFWIAAAGATAWAGSAGRIRYALLALAALAIFATPQALAATQLLRTPLALLRGRTAPTPSLPSVPLNSFVTDSGLVVWVPAVGDQAWDAPLPSAPGPDPKLRARCPQDLSCGFSKN